MAAGCPEGAGILGRQADAEGGSGAGCRQGDDGAVTHTGPRGDGGLESWKKSSRFESNGGRRAHARTRRRECPLAVTRSPTARRAGQRRRRPARRRTRRPPLRVHGCPGPVGTARREGQELVGRRGPDDSVAGTCGLLGVGLPDTPPSAAAPTSSSASSSRPRRERGSSAGPHQVTCRRGRRDWKDSTATTGRPRTPRPCSRAVANRDEQLRVALLVAAAWRRRRSLGHGGALVAVPGVHRP